MCHFNWFYKKTNIHSHLHTHTHTRRRTAEGLLIKYDRRAVYTRAELAEYSPPCTSYYLWNKVLPTHIKSMLCLHYPPVLLWPIALKHPVLPSQRKPLIPCQFPTEQSPAYEQFWTLSRGAYCLIPKYLLFICCRE